MLKRALIGLLLVSLMDALFLVVVATQIGAVLTVALVVLTALVGTLFVRAEGRHTIRQIQRTLASGEVPTAELTDGALLIAAGAFLLSPGLLTDTIGFLLAFPPTRIPIRKAIQARIVVPYVERKTGGFATGNVYTFGFPNADDVGPGASTTGANAGSTGTGSEDTYRVDDDAYDIDFDDDDEDR